MRKNGNPVRGYHYAGAGQPDQPWQSEKCGTLRGYDEHRRNGDPRCDPCWEARAAYTREWRIATGRQQTIRVRLTPAQLELLRRLP